MPNITVAGVQLHYRDEGSGNPLLLLHGNPGSNAVWNKVYPELAQHYRVIAHDRQGFGQSEKIEEGDFSPQGYTEELIRLMDELKIETAHICGLSLGGMVAQCMALDYPERVQNLILIATTADRTGRPVKDNLAELKRDGWPRVAARLNGSWFHDTSDSTDISNSYKACLQSSQRMRELTVTALGKFDIKDRIHDIKAPTLVLVGAKDTLNPMGFSENLSNSIPDAKLIILSECGHQVPMERPEAFCELVHAFLNETN